LDRVVPVVVDEEEEVCVCVGEVRGEMKGG
jgi:hypothetical protein